MIRAFLRQTARPSTACGVAALQPALSAPPQRLPLLHTARCGLLPCGGRSISTSRSRWGGEGPPTDTRMVGEAGDAVADDETRTSMASKLKGSAGRDSAVLPTQAEALVEDRRKRAFARACHEGDTETVEAFVQGGGDVTDERVPVYPLHIAVSRGHVELAALLLKHGADADYYAGVKEAGPAALHLAAEGGSAPMVALLLDNGADVNLSATKFDATPLHFAAINGHAGAAAALVAAGADTAALTNTGSTPAQVAEEAGHGATIGPLLA